MNNQEKFTFSEVLEYIEKIPSSDRENIVLIGGQALNVWSELYLSHKSELQPFASKDLDFLINDIKLMVRLANHWNGKLAVNDDITSTHCGIVFIEDVQKQIQADFLSTVHGLFGEDIRKKMISIVFKEINLNVMHPIHCLESRFENIIGLRRHDEHSINQLKIAIEVVKARIMVLINQGEIRDALNEIESVFKFLKRNKNKRQEIFDQYEIDLFDAIPNNNRLGKMYVEKRYHQMKKVLQLRGQKE